MANAASPPSAPTSAAAATSGDCVVSAHELGRKWKGVPWADVMDGEGEACYYFMRSGLIRKDLLPRYAPGAVPLTIVAKDHAALVAAVASRLRGCGGGGGQGQQEEVVRAWVLKYTDSSNAWGMRFFDGADAAAVAALGACMEDGAKRIIQRYVPPHLIPLPPAPLPPAPLPPPAATAAAAAAAGTAAAASGGAGGLHKYHLRALVLSVGNLRAFVHREVRVLIATKPFATVPSAAAAAAAEEAPSGASATASAAAAAAAAAAATALGARTDLDDPYVHITNMSSNEDHRDYHRSRQNVELLPPLPPVAPTGTAAGAGAGAGHQQHHPLGDRATAEAAYESICEIVEELWGALSANRKHFFALPNCWELFGLDFMLDEQRKVWLLEANPDPSMKMFGGPRFREQMLGGLSSPLPDGAALEAAAPGAFRQVYDKPPEYSLKEALRRLRAAGQGYKEQKQKEAAEAQAAGGNGAQAAADESEGAGEAATSGLGDDVD